MKSSITHSLFSPFSASVSRGVRLVPGTGPRSGLTPTLARLDKAFSRNLNSAAIGKPTHPLAAQGPKKSSYSRSQSHLQSHIQSRSRQQRCFSTTSTIRQAKEKSSTTTSLGIWRNLSRQKLHQQFWKFTGAESGSVSVRWMYVSGIVTVTVVAILLLPYTVPAAYADAAGLVRYPRPERGVPRLHEEHRSNDRVASKSTDTTSTTETGTSKVVKNEVSNNTTHIGETKTGTVEKTEAATIVANDVPRFRLDEIQAHGKDADAVWVVRGTRVYNITDWIPNHPGGSVILRAAGGNLDAFWKIFTVHQKQDVYDILEQYFIGVVDERDLVDGKVAWEEGVDDPFKDDPVRDPRLRRISDQPCSAETPAEELVDNVTPNELFYVRNHFWVPNEKAEEHTLTIEREDGTEVIYTIEELRKRFREHSITATLQCAGNRRSHMTAAVRTTNGLQWDVGAIGNAVWTGVLLRDVLADAGLDVNDVPEDVKHACFEGTESYATSIPIEKVVDKRGDVLLAYDMNGKRLPRDHGFPLRVVVPGHVAARSVKWLKRISLSDEESFSQWQRKDYKLFGPNVGAKPDWDSAPSIQEMPVQSAITKVTTRTVENGVSTSMSSLGNENIIVEGYATAGGGRRIVRVDISADGGLTWHQAELLKDGTEEAGPKRAWAWQRWRFDMPRQKGNDHLLVKAVDEGYNTQPRGFECHYTHRGNLACGWHKVALPAAAGV